MKPITQEQIDSRNFINSQTVEYRDKILPIFEKYIGKKVRKVTPYSTLIQKIKDELEPIGEEFRKNGIHIVYMVSDYRITFELKNYKSNNGYTKQWFYLGFLVDGVILEKMADYPEHIYKQYTLEDVNNTVAEMERLKERLSECKDEISDFIK